MKRIVIGITGASGTILAYKTISELLKGGNEVELLVSKNAAYAASFELPENLASAEQFLKTLPPEDQKRVRFHKIGDVGCSVASGTYPTDGMVIVPCSMATLAAISYGLSDNSLRRAADVTLKERRPLIIVPRECPFSEIHLENLLKVTRLGATVVPPIPAWYTQPRTLEDIENFIVGRILDALKISHNLFPRWHEELVKKP